MIGFYFGLFIYCTSFLGIISTYLGFELPGKSDVALDVLYRVHAVNGLLLPTVEVHNTPGNSVVHHLNVIRSLVYRVLP